LLHHAAREFTIVQGQHLQLSFNNHQPFLGPPQTFLGGRSWRGRPQQNRQGAGGTKKSRSHFRLSQGHR
jgi:hypothetical protein